MKISFTVFFCILVIFGCSPLKIEIWYGKHQKFGKPGIAQKWVNILGSIDSKNGIAESWYRLNDEDKIFLSVGKDDRRLANPGDFNIDIDTALLKKGINSLLIEVIDSFQKVSSVRVRIDYNPSEKWPIPYVLNWDEVEEIQKAVQVVDGHWKFTSNGIRTLDTYYDRVLAIGDGSWDNYEVITTVTFHDFTPPSKGPPTYGVSHAAIATRWPGHDLDDQQPHVKWYPLGATAEFRLTRNLDSCRWRIFDGENLYVEDLEKVRKISLGTKYHMKHRVNSLGDDSTLYQVKLWKEGEPEPGSWDLEALEPPGNVSSGSALLIAHHTDVTFGDVMVRPIGNK